MKKFENLTEKQKAWLVGTAKRMHEAVGELVEFLERNEKRTGAEFWREFGSYKRKAEDAVWKHLAAKHKINKTFDTDEFTKDFRLTLHMIALRIKETENFEIRDWTIDDEEELAWVIS